MNLQGERITKRYTPIYNFRENNLLSLLVKVYRPNIQFPTGGRVSQYLDRIKVGEEIEIKYPYGKVCYLGNSVFMFKKSSDNLVIENLNEWEEKKYNKIAFIAGGTGITPIFQILSLMNKNKENNLELHLIYGTKSKEDVLLMEDLESLKDNLNIKIKYVIESQEGYISKSHISGFIPKSDDTLILVCGSKIMTKNYIHPILQELNYNSNQIVLF